LDAQPLEVGAAALLVDVVATGGVESPFVPGTVGRAARTIMFVGCGE
jgi:hypothetical protein